MSEWFWVSAFLYLLGIYPMATLILHATNLSVRDSQYLALIWPVIGVAILFVAIKGVGVRDE